MKNALTKNLDDPILEAMPASTTEHKAVVATARAQRTLSRRRCATDWSWEYPYRY